VNELTFLDLAILKRIDENSTVERFGTTINTSFFETANLLGTLKVKGFINIEPSVGGISKVSLTDAGMGILKIADERLADDMDSLDSAILRTLATGVKDLNVLSSVLNIKSSDLAYHLNNLHSRKLIDYGMRSARVSLSLTEKGFNKTGAVKGVKEIPVKEEKHEGVPPAPEPEEELPVDWRRKVSKGEYYLSKYLAHIVIGIAFLLVVIMVIIATLFGFF
jgi:hypothetical protein